MRKFDVMVMPSAEEDIIEIIRYISGSSEQEGRCILVSFSNFGFIVLDIFRM